MWIEMSLLRDVDRDVTVERCGYRCHCREMWIEMSL